MHRPSTRRLSLAGPGFSTPFQSHSKRCFTIATHFSTTPLHHWAFLFHPVANLIWTMHFHYDASPSNAFTWLIGAFPCCSVASKTYAIHFRGCATPRPRISVRGDSLLCHSISIRSGALPCRCHTFQLFAVPLLASAPPLRFKAVQNHCVPWHTSASRCHCPVLRAY